MFQTAKKMKNELKQAGDEIFPYWHFDVLSNSIWHFEEYIPMWNHTEESEKMKAYDEMLRSFRGSLGLNVTMDQNQGIDLSAKEEDC